MAEQAGASEFAKEQGKKVAEALFSGGRHGGKTKGKKMAKDNGILSRLRGGEPTGRRAKKSSKASIRASIAKSNPNAGRRAQKSAAKSAGAGRSG